MERHITSRIHQTPSRRYAYVPRFTAVRPLIAPARAQVMRSLSSIRGNRPHCATTNTIRKYSANGNSEV